METVLEMVEQVRRGPGFTKIFCITNDAGFVGRLMELEPDTQMVLATSSKPLADSLADSGVRVRRISEKSMGALNLFSQSEEVIRAATAEGLFTPEDKVICLFFGAVVGALVLDVHSVGISRLREALGPETNMEVVEALLNLSLEIAQEGREGQAVGALFIIGDTDEVLKTSRQVIINPFKGHSEEARNVLKKDNWETIKEFAQLDGAFVVDDKGLMVAAGRYMGVNWDIYLQGGLGGRHLAAASVSKMTKAVAMVVSTQGAVRIFKGGRELFKISAV